MTLFEQSINWLSEASMDTRKLMNSYVDYIKTISDDLASELTVDSADIINKAESVRDNVNKLVDAFLEGKIYEALKISEGFLCDFISFAEIPKDTVFFRARGNNRGYIYEKEEMFHIPFDKRNVIGNQRYSITGVPCLYLGGSAFICWEELSRPEFQTCNFSGFKNKETVRVYDMCMPEKIESIEDIERVGLILACSMHANSADVFKEEYILPQCLLQAIINKHYCDGKDDIVGVKYISTHVLNNSRQMFQMDITNKESVRRFTNYVFPSICSNKGEKFSPMLSNGFDYTLPCSYTELLIKNDATFFGNNDDEYLDSFYGKIEHQLIKMLGVKSSWTEAPIFCCQPDGDDAE